MSTPRPRFCTDVCARLAPLCVALMFSLAACSGGSEGAPDPTEPLASPGDAPEQAPDSTPGAVEEGNPAAAEETGTPDEAAEDTTAEEVEGTSADKLEPATATDAAAGSLDDLAALVSSFEGPTPSLEQLRAASPHPEAGLIQLARDASQVNAVRQGALRALGTTAGAPARALLSEMLAPGTSRALRRAAIQGADPLLTEDSDLAALVTEATGDDDPGVARAAVLALADVPGARAHLEALGQEELAPAVRSAVDEVLGNPSAPSVPIAVPSSTPTEGRGGR